ncbi:HpcH/HpaI aldolase family protein [Devosia sp.]|uniref:HpcH/HpaI aldolase family protein n=1 Tax=Devosia sp. TaxID=1871048 RepID=UPI003A9044A4
MPALPPNRFKRNIASGTRQIGLWLSLESPVATEMVADSGFDWLLLDMEHSPVGLSQVAAHVNAARGGTAELVVRVPSVDPILVKTLLDAGVRSIMFPFVQSVAEAELAVASMLYPPRGIRGVSGNSRANQYTRNRSYLETYADEQCAIIQVESPLALDTIPEFAKIDELDAIFIGPNDLAANMGMLGQPNSDAVQQQVGAALKEIKAGGKAAGLLDFTPEAADSWLARGFDFVAVGSDAALLVGHADALAARFRP